MSADRSPSLDDQFRPYHWQCVTESGAFAPRDGAGALVHQDRMWLLGGWNPGDKVNFPDVCNSEVWTSVDGATWERVNRAAPWEGRHTAGYAVHQDRIWIVGGDCDRGHYQNDVWSSADGVAWQQHHDTVPWGPRALHYTVAFDGRIWVMGGQTMPNFAPGAGDCFYNDVWCSEDGSDWQCVCEHAPWSPRGMIGGSAVMDGRIWLLGGGTYDTPDHPDRLYYSDVWSTPDGVNWQCHTGDAAWHPRQYHDVAVFDDRLWVMEGYHIEPGVGILNRGNRNDVWYSSNGVDWHEVPDTPWPPRHAASLFAHAGALWMVAGNNMASDVWRLTHAE